MAGFWLGVKGMTKMTKPIKKPQHPKPRNTKEAKKKQGVRDRNKRRRSNYRTKRKRDAWKKGAVGADECVGNMSEAIYIV